MLTDTYTAQAFFQDFKSDTARALRWTTLRQDSGDAFAFVKEAKNVWEEVEIQAGLSEEKRKKRVKRVIFSDGLDVESALRLQQGCDDIGIGGERATALYFPAGAHGAASFGIGTFLTNDFKRTSDPSQTSKALNIVIKLNQIDGKDCVKLSDDKGKVSLTWPPRIARQCEELIWQHTGDAEEVKRAKAELNIPA
jgi:nicotinate phosphoribosyltransferase